MHILESELPPPLALVKCASGEEVALMFYYAAENTNLQELANDCGYDVMAIDFFHDVDDGEELSVRYEAGEDIVDEWQPTPQPGWTLALKTDSDNGPFAVFVRKREDS